MENRHFFFALTAALLAFFVFTIVFRTFVPPPTPPEQQDAAVSTTQPTTQPAATQPGPAVTDAPRQPTTRAGASGAGTLQFAGGVAVETLELGGREGDALRATLTTRGAGIATLELTSRNKKGRYVHRQKPDGNDPYRILEALADNQIPRPSYLTRSVYFPEADERVTIESSVWEVREHTPSRIVFHGTIVDAAGRPLVEIDKRFELVEDKPLIDLTVETRNVSGRVLTLSVEQGGPAGIPREHIQYDMRSVMATHYAEGAVADPVAKRRGAVLDEMQELYKWERDQPFAWTALANKFFAVYTRPLPSSATESPPDVIAGVDARALIGSEFQNGPHPGDMQTILRAKAVTLTPDVNADATLRFEVYAGPMDHEVLAKVNPAFASATGLAYYRAVEANYRCCCTFQPLAEVMAGLLQWIWYVVRNYGVAIIILVIIIRGLLHPLTVFQQKSMYKTQEAMAKIQPKIKALQAKYKNDPQTLQREQMKLYAEENVNPLGMFVAMVPMIIQMPILIALWTAINTDIHLRHAPFDGVWIDNLAAPDALISFPGDGLTVPLLSSLPFIGRIFTNIPSFNLLPILMGVAMWLQQRYMPKPGMEARKEAEAQQRAENPEGHHGTSVEDQMRQQQTIAYVMSIMFPLMFYYMPAGLNLYWMATNVFGIGESILIRRQIRREKEKRELLGQEAVKPKKKGPVAKFFQRLADQAQEMQKQADELSERDKRGHMKTTSSPPRKQKRGKRKK